jgi:pyruvate/2-oxoglutarate dehydrogenase complex dihydrolipoamide dehydrogenase (E3) component
MIIASHSVPNLQGLNLESVGVAINPNGVFVRETLQTTHPRIYACGSVLAGYSSTNIVQHEAEIILKNILCYPRYKIDYTNLAYCLFTTPAIARVGLTERQARYRYGDRIQVIQQPYKLNDQAQILGQTTGFLKLIVHARGNILGGHIIGVQAEEIIGVIALAIQQKIKIQSLANLSFPTLTISESIHQIALEYQRQTLQKNKKLLDWLETWLIWRRKLVKK